MGKFLIKETATGVKFDLKASNGQVIGTSEVYSSKSACKNGIASVQKNAPVAAVENQRFLPVAAVGLGRHTINQVAILQQAKPLHDRVLDGV